MKDPCSVRGAFMHCQVICIEIIMDTLLQMKGLTQLSLNHLFKAGRLEINDNQDLIQSLVYTMVSLFYQTSLPDTGEIL